MDKIKITIDKHEKGIDIFETDGYLLLRVEGDDIVTSGHIDIKKFGPLLIKYAVTRFGTKFGGE